MHTELAELARLTDVITLPTVPERPTTLRADQESSSSVTPTTTLHVTIRADQRDFDRSNDFGLSSSFPTFVVERCGGGEPTGNGDIVPMEQEEHHKRENESRIIDAISRSRPISHRPIWHPCDSAKPHLQSPVYCQQGFVSEECPDV